jgi:type I restriction enzyme S subunit
VTTITEAIPSAPRRRAFTAWYKDLARWDIGSFSTLSWAWPPDIMQPLGGVLRRVIRDVDTSDLRSIPIIEKITFGGVASVLPVDDREGYKGRLFWAEPGQFVYSRIRAKQGSFTVVDPAVGRLAVSQEYPVYDIARDRIDPEFLKLALRSQAFLSLMAGLSHGGSTKTRMLPDQFESLKIPVPPLAVQRRIVAAAAKARAQAARLRAEADEREAAIGVEVLRRLGLKAPAVTGTRPRHLTVWWTQVERWGVDFMIRALQGGTDLHAGKYPVLTLGEIATVSYGIQKSPANRPGKHARPYLRVANVQAGRLDLSEIKYIEVPDSLLAGFLLQPGDMLFVEGNGSRRELGRAAIWNGEIDGCVHQNHLIKVRPSRDKVRSEYIDLWFNAGLGRDHFFHSAKSTSGLGTINSTEVRSAPIPLPALKEQDEIIAVAGRIRAEVEGARTKARAIEIAAEMNVEQMILGALQP